MGGSVNGLVGKVGNLAQMFKSFGKGGYIGLALAGVSSLIAGIAHGIKSSAENTAAWRKQIAMIKPLVDGWDTFWEKVGKGFMDFVTGIGIGLAYQNRSLDSYLERTRKASELVDRQIANENSLLDIQQEEIENQEELNKLKATASDSDRKTFKEREAALKKIDAIESSLDAKRIAAAEEAYNLQVDARKGEQASVEEKRKEQELYIAWQKTIVDAQKNQIDREKELYQLQKDAGQEALDYRIRILESERNLLETKVRMVEAGTQEELDLRLAIADKELEIDKATAEKEKKNMVLKNKQLLEAEVKYQQAVIQIRDDFNAITIQKVKDNTDKMVAEEVNGWKKAEVQVKGLVEEYEKRLKNGKPQTQTTEEWEKELAQMRETIRKTWLNSVDDLFGDVNDKIFSQMNTMFNEWEQGTSDYLLAEVEAYKKAYEQIADERGKMLPMEQLEGETDEQYRERQKQQTLAFDKNLYDMKKKIVDGYTSWYFKKMTETETDIVLQNRKTFEEYVKGIPHNVWDYMFKPTDNSMQTMQNDLNNAQKIYEESYANITKIMKERWNEEEQVDFDWNEAFKLLPDEVQTDYLSKLEDLKDKEQGILKQRLTN